jgi:uncharacterized repeat protein (TIGR01451 family)
MKRLALIVTGALLLSLTSLIPMTSAFADSNSINFEPPPYSALNPGPPVGSIDGQDGWGGTSGTPVNTSIDQSVVLTSAYPAAPTAGFALQSFRMSNAFTTDSFSDQVFSPSLTDEAGETSAVSDGFADGARQTRFVAQWDFASATGAAQTGLSTVVSPDRGDGARMSWIQMTDTGGTGLEVNFFDYQHNIGFVETNVASGLDRTTAHTIKVQMDFVDGIANDVVKVYVDGTLKHTGTSWEDFFRDVELNPTRPVDSLLFRVAGTAAPATAGNGFLFDNLTLFSGPTPAPSADLSVTKTDSPDPAHVGQKLTYTIPVTNNGPDSAAGISLTDTLPKTTGFGSVSTTQGTCTRTKKGVTCNLGTLASGATATVTIVVKPTQKGTITNTVTVAATSPSDPNTANNTAIQGTVVKP